MKLARVRDYKRRLVQRGVDWPFRLERFLFQDVPSLGSGEISFTTPVTILAGPNGVGKTTLLRAIWAALAGELANPSPSTVLKLSAGNGTLECHRKDQVVTSNVTFAAGKATGGEPLGLEVTHIDASSDAIKQQNDFCAFESVEDLINGVGSRALEGKALAEVSYISCRDYREVKVYEVEAEQGVVPFFEVSYGDDRYDSRTMGTGELATLYLWWALDNAPENAVLLIEEPETYLSPASQTAITHFIITRAVDQHLNVIMTSHSPKIIFGAPEECANFLFREGGNTRILGPTAPPGFLETLGISPHIDLFVVVEDDAAEVMTRHILEMFSPAMSRRAEILIAEGEGNITAILRKVSGQFRAIKFVGAYDGDMRDRMPKELAPHAVALPGDHPIEELFREMVVGDPDSLAQSIGSDNVRPVLFSLEGKDCHDWYAGLCDQLGLTRQQLFPILFRLWVKRPENEAASKATFDRMAELLYPPAIESTT